MLADGERVGVRWGFDYEVFSRGRVGEKAGNLALTTRFLTKAPTKPMRGNQGEGMPLPYESGWYLGN